MYQNNYDVANLFCFSDCNLAMSFETASKIGKPIYIFKA